MPADDVFAPGPRDRTVRTSAGEVRVVPAGWQLLPPGDAGLTRKVKALGPEKHFYWFKKQSADTKEWSEMSVYPRATWGASFV